MTIDSAGRPTPSQHDCLAGFTALWQHLVDGLEAHADRDGLTGLKRTLFMARGDHPPGVACPTAPAGFPPPHRPWCTWPDDECECHHVH